MYVWRVLFQVYRPLNSLARPNRAACEIIDDPNQCYRGRVRHDRDLLFVYTLEGQHIFRHRKSDWLMEPGTGFLCRASDPDVSWFQPSGVAEPWKFVWLNFEGDAPEAVVREMNQRYGFIYHLPSAAPAIRRLMALPEYKQKPYALTPHAGSALVSDFLAELIASAENDHSEDSQVQLIRTAQQIMVDEIEASPTVADIAKRCNLSREHFTRIFSTITGMTPRRFLLQERMLVASRLLEERELSCKEIAVRLGYADSAAFSRAFATYFGYPPTSALFFK